MAWILQRIDQGGGFVADMRRSSGSSYTHNILSAKQYPTEEAAKADSCHGNEIPVSLNRLLRRD